MIVAAARARWHGRPHRPRTQRADALAQLDSLPRNCFGVSPAIILYLWALKAWPRFGWVFAIAYAACMALRLARFNARINAQDQPQNRPGSSPACRRRWGRGLLLPIILGWRAAGNGLWLQDYRLVAPWAAFVAFLAYLERRHLFLGVAAAAPPCQAGGNRRDRADRRGALVSAPLGDAERRRHDLFAAIPFSI